MRRLAETVGRKLRGHARTALIAASLFLVCATEPVALAESSPGGHKPQSHAPPLPDQFQPFATFQEIMDAEMDSASEKIWQAVAIKSDATGLHEKKPATDAEWHELRQQAIVLVEAANLVMIPGRRVAAGDKTIETREPLDVKAIERRLASNPAQLASFAANLRLVALKIAAATDKRNVEEYFDLGGELDEACEACHLVFWYPPR